ncbi:MAG: hypothetical protein IAC77_01115 [Proteobacteria bacterium]|uniref:Uncharacterized protein n=1 Tax=Candidatus Enterousia excrementavium TaxID=2840789 RepID=A0A940IC40_9PROT|nr:hypothetical protein [Candidatus Enterousia excrementavium]
MNWKRIIGASAGVIAVVAAVFFVKSCTDQRVSDAIVDTRAELAKARQLVSVAAKQLDSLQQAADTYRDSTEFYKNGLAECEKSKRGKGTVSKPAKPAPAKKPVEEPVVDTVYVVCEQAGPSQKGGDTSIRLQNDSKNNQNIVVQNANQYGNDTEIVLGQGAVNDGNIVVNNGGNVTVYDKDPVVDSLRNVVDSLKANSAKRKFKASSSVVIVKTINTYKRVR